MTPSPPAPAGPGPARLLTRRRVWFGFGVVLHLIVLYAPRAPSTGDLPIDKMVHALIFAEVLWLGARAQVPVLPLTAVLSAHAVISELIQHWLLRGRSGDLLDTVADLTGVLIVTLVLRLHAARAASPG